MRYHRTIAVACFAAFVTLGNLGARAQGKIQPRIVFTVDHDIFRIDLNGRNLRGLNESRTLERAPSWSPDGRHIAFESRNSRGMPVGVYVMKSNGEDIRVLSDHVSGDYRPTWSPGGKRIAFVSNRDNWGWAGVFVMDADGSNQHIVTGGILFADNYPAWSPDGRRIAFMSSRDGDDEIYTMNADGTDPRRLTNSAGRDSGPTWSPDGGSIAFASSRDGASDLYIMEVDGGKVRRLTDTPVPGGSIRPLWSPDGELISFLSSRGRPDPTQLFVIDPRGQHERQVTDMRSSVQSGGSWYDAATPRALSNVGKLLSTWGWLKGPL
jgi:TolB protein